MTLDQRTRLNDLFQAIGVKQPAEPEVAKTLLERASESIPLSIEAKIDEANYRTQTLNQFRLHALADYHLLINSLENGTLVELLSVSAEGFRRAKNLKSELILGRENFESQHISSDICQYSTGSKYLEENKGLLAAWMIAHEQQSQSVQSLIEFFEYSAKLIDQRIVALMR